MPQHSPWIIQGATHKIVDALLTLIFRVGLWPCRDHFCSEQLPIRWLWSSAVAELLDYTRCNTQNHWHSVDTLLTQCWCCIDALLTLRWRSFGGVAVLTHTILPAKAAKTSIMDKCRSTAFGLHKMQPIKSLTLCWRSFSDLGSDHFAITFAQNGCQYVDYGYMP
jgi:hypothetical protein